jgi:hypothetical protein
VRQQMENAFGSDFSGVRVHTGAGAHSLNKALNAIAFTTGQDIFFRDSAYDPGSPAGKELLAHELTHVVQQGGATVQGKLVLGAGDDPYEREAGSVAREVIAGLESANTALSVQRECACGGHADSGECAACRQERESAAQNDQLASGRRLQRQDDGDTTNGDTTGGVVGLQVDINTPGFPCNFQGGIMMCNTTKDSESAPNFSACFASAKGIIDSCKGVMDDCLAQAKCSLCQCLGPRYCPCTGIV